MINIVICDDNESTANMISDTIDWKALNCTVKAVEYDGNLGLNSIRKFQPQLIITDINMPGIDGLEMIKQAQIINPSVKFIFITAHDNFKYAHEAVKLHAFDYILKPFARRELVYTISRVVKEITEDGSSKNISSSKTADIPMNIQRMIKYMENKLSDDINLEMLSDEFGISSSHISRSIKQYTGKSYNQFLIQLRIDKAKFLLTDPRLNISEISNMVGYRNYITFYKVFSRECGLSPSEFRKNQKIVEIR